MVFVKILGGIDIFSSLAFLMLVFGITPLIQIILFCAGLLLLKGMMIFTGEIPLSIIDLFSSLILILSIFWTLPALLLWIPAFLLMAKGIVSFI
jgi:hypothetical protein